MAPDITGKQLQLLKEAAPTISRLAVLYNPTFPATVPLVQEAQAAGLALGLTILPLAVRTADELDAQLAVMTRVHTDALLTSGDPFTSLYQSRLLDFAAQHQLPASYAWREWVEAGGLMSYRPSLRDLFRRAATYVHKILHDATPADLPVEQPSKFEFVLNLKTAQSLGLTLPPHLLVFADEVIQ